MVNKICYFIQVNLLKKTGLDIATIERIARSASLSHIYNFEVVKSRSILPSVKVKRDYDLVRYMNDNYEFDNDNIYSVKIDIGFLMRVIYKLGLSILVYRYIGNKISKYIDCEMIVSHWGETPGVYSNYVSQTIGAKNICYFHGSDIHTLPYKNSQYKKALMDTLRNSSLNVFVSKGLLDDSKQLGHDSGNNMVIYNGVVPFKDMTLSTIKFDLDKPNIVYVGNLEKVKGVEFIPQIVTELKEHLPTFNLHIVGDGTFRSFLEQQLANDYTYFYGSLKPLDVGSVLKQSDIVIVPSINEGMPLVVLESISLGKKVVAANVGGIPELIPPNNLISHGPTFPKKFAEKITRVLNEPNETVVDISNFDWDVITNKEKEVYRDILNS